MDGSCKIYGRGRKIGKYLQTEYMYGRVHFEDVRVWI
jgi:hypothetical protein